MTTSMFRLAALPTGRLDEIRERLAQLSNPDATYQPYSYATMLRETITEIDRLTAELAGDRPAFRLSVDDITCGHYASRDEARLHAHAAAAEAGMPLKTPHWVPADGASDAPEDLCRVDGYGDSVPTGYRITPITIAARYDPDAQW